MLTRRHHKEPSGRRGSGIINFFSLLVMVICLSACSPKVIEKVVIQRDTLMVHHRDTTYRRDSVYIREWMKGDTVFVEKYKDRYVFRDRWRDSIQVRERHDTTTVEVKVERALTWSQKVRIGAFPWVLLALVGALLWIFRKWIFKT